MGNSVRNFKDWKRFAKKNNFKCAYCGCDLLSNESVYATATIGNFKRQGKRKDKLILICSLCNRVAKDKAFENMKEAKAKVGRLRKRWLNKYEYNLLKKRYRR